MSASLQTILDDEYLGDLTAIDMAALRARRADCVAVETGLSFLRRLAQGRLDVVIMGLTIRSEGGDAADLDGLIDRLPAVLAASTRSPGVGRLPVGFGTGDIDPDLAAELDEIIADSHLTSLDELDDDTLAAARDALASYEQKVSEFRRRLFDRLDAIEAELTRRYRTGEASVDSLLG